MKKLFALLLITFIAFKINAQSGAAINTTGSAAAPSAILDVSSTNAGILIPRMAEVQKNTIPSPATGLMIYQTDGATGFWYYNGAIWVQAIGPTGPTGSDGVPGAAGNNGATGATGATGAAASCPPANSGETLINYNGCLYVKNVDESGTYTWADANSKCTSLGAGWYLPSKNDFNTIYQNWNQPANGGTCNGGVCPLSGFVANIYWSSTLNSPGYAWFQDFYAGVQNPNPLTSTNRVRCVRR